MTRIDLQVTKAGGSRCWGAGFVAVDIVETEIKEFAATGGSCGNVMAILAWLGWSTTPVARLGEDASGDFVCNELSEGGVDTQFLSREAGVQTPIVIQRFVRDKDGGQVHRFSLTCPECRAWLPRHRPITLQQAGALVDSGQRPNAYYFDRVSPAAIRLASVARENGALVVFEPSSVGDEKKFQTAVDLCHVLKYSQDRLGHLPDLAVTASPRIIVETQGEDGLRFRWKNRWSHLDAFEVNPFVDAAGAGDWCTAGLIHRIGQVGAKGLRQLRKEDLVVGLRTGQAIAAINCNYYGARGAMLAISLRTLNQRLRLLAVQPIIKPIDDATEVITSQPPVDYCHRCDPTDTAGVFSTKSHRRLA